MFNLEALLKQLAQHQVSFILVGGVAATAHGSARLTQDLDIVYDRSPANLTRLALALSSCRPYLRGAPPGLPFKFDAPTLKRGLNFTLTTSLGALDLLGEITGGGGYQALLPFTLHLDLFGLDCLCLALDKLIAVKRAVGWPKDLEVIAELESILAEKQRGSSPGSP